MIRDPKRPWKRENNKDIFKIVFSSLYSCIGDYRLSTRKWKY